MGTQKIQEGENFISRRAFINRAAAGTMIAAFTPVSSLIANAGEQATTWPAGASKLKFYMIGHGHIDPVWLWPWREGISIVHSTFRSALDRMNETEGLFFTCSSAQFYQWVAENDPQMMAEIRKRVDEGRWNIIGGWWVEPDMNIPSGEALVRQGLYGQLTFQRLLGQRAKTAFNPDSFGHTSTLPQIIRLQGMENYVFMRPGPTEKTIPSDLFWWEGIDGTRVMTYRVQRSYGTSYSMKDRLKLLLEDVKELPMTSFMAYYGIGDHGGGPTKYTIQTIEEVKKEKGAPVLFYSTPDQYFSDARADKKLNLPVVKDDLQHHAAGCYTVEAEIKKGNRHSETALVDAEKIAAIGSIAWGANYPMRELTTAWQRVLFLQFHDSLAGTSLFEHSQAAREGYGYALDIAHQAMYMAAQKLEWQVPSEDPDSEYLLLFNPHAWEVNTNIEYDFEWNETVRKSSRVEDEQGNSLPHQWRLGQAESGGRKMLIFNTNIPAMGYRQIRVSDNTPLLINSAAKAENNVLENEYLRVRFSSNGSIGILDKKTGKEVFTGGETGCKAVIIDDPSDTWSHKIKTFSKEVGAFDRATVKVLENGPLRASIRVVTTYGDSKLSIDWILTAGSANLEARVTLDWHERLKMLKFSFPVDVESPEATYETPYGHIVRQTNGDEDPGMRWIDLSGKQNGNIYGLTVVNDAKYGYSVSGNDMRISVIRSAVYAHHDPKVLDMSQEHLWMDQGIHTFRMLLVPHKETWKESRIPRVTEEFMSQPVTIYQGIHRGTMPKSGSFLAVDAENIVVSALKYSEEGEDLIVRCVETYGKSVTATVDLRIINRKWTGNFRPNEIKTLRINPQTGNIKEVNLLEE